MDAFHNVDEGKEAVKKKENGDTIKALKSISKRMPGLNNTCQY